MFGFYCVRKYTGTERDFQPSDSRPRSGSVLILRANTHTLHLSMGIRARDTPAAVLLLLLVAPVIAQTPFRASDSVSVITAHRAAFALDPLSRVYTCTDTLSLIFADGPGDSASVRLHPSYAVVEVKVLRPSARSTWPTTTHRSPT